MRIAVTPPATRRSMTACACADAISGKQIVYRAASSSSEATRRTGRHTDIDTGIGKRVMRGEGLG